MINQVYQLISPRNFSIKYEDINLDDNHVIIRPRYLSLCHADQRYYQGKRAPEILAKKLPCALVHEACGEVVADNSGVFSIGQKVVMIPNQPKAKLEKEFYENYSQGGFFRSSGHDGFMQELVVLPSDRVVSYEHIPGKLASITEFISVAVHAIERLKRLSHPVKDRIVIWGDGSLAYVAAIVARHEYPDSTIIVVGKNEHKLNLFTFVDEVYNILNIPQDFTFDHALECCGGEGSFFAIDDIIKYIKPQGTIILMGVSENKIAINTRDILEKGLLVVGSSRSGRYEFEKSIHLLSNETVQSRLLKIVSFEGSIRSIDDIHKIFSRDLYTSFKTVFKWEI